MPLVSSLIAAAMLLQSAEPQIEPLYLFTCGVPLPTEAEIEEYVRTNWQDFEDRLRPYPAVAQERMQLVRVEGATCGYRLSTPHCRFRLIGRQAAGDAVSAMLETAFARNREGRLAGEVDLTGPDPACKQD